MFLFPACDRVAAPRGGDNLPLEEITFNYDKVEWTYTETDLMTGEPIGDISAHWDLRLNTGG